MYQCQRNSNDENINIIKLVFFFDSPKILLFYVLTEVEVETGDCVTDQEFLLQ